MNFRTRKLRFSQILLIVLPSFCAIFGASGCTTSAARENYFGKTIAPSRNVLRYVSGPEPETLDPQISPGQPEARIYMALYDGLVEYDPKDMHPIPAIAETWEISPGADEFVFHLRKNARWSDGVPITARDFVYSLRRGFAPETLSRTANNGYYIKYSEAFNSSSVFAKRNDEFLLSKDFPETSGAAATTAKNENAQSFSPETDFHKFIRAPERLVLSGDEKKRAKQIAADPKLKTAVEGVEFIPVTAADIGVEAIDDYTLRLTLKQNAPFFLGLLAHQFFRLVPQHAIEKYGKNWTRPENIVTCGAFKVKAHKPYDVLSLERDPAYWDAANVKLDEIDFYLVEELSTILNLYKAGEIDAFLNHTVPLSWIDEIRQYKDEYLNFPENATTYFSMNMRNPPFDNLKVRQAFNLSVDKEALSKWRKITQPLYDLTPAGIFPDYDKARSQISEEIRQQRGISPQEWQKRDKFDPERARQLLTEAGFPVEKTGDGFACPSFPVDKVSFVYNTNEGNKAIGEFVQAQWKQNLGVTVPMKNMEFKAFLPYKNSLQYTGFAITIWSGDYMDPFTFLNLHYGEQNDGTAGFHDVKYDQMLDEANNEIDLIKRNEKMARAEFYLTEQQPMIPLTINATNWMKKPYVKGLYPNPGTLHAWKYVYIERDPPKWDRDVANIMK